MRFSTKLLCAVASVALLPAAPASAQTVTRIVAFGDSYVDDGNLFELLGIPRPAVYPTGRFSGGTNFVDTMGQILAVPIDNFGIGGAFTGNGNINGAGIPGFVTEYSSFLAGGGPAAFPRVSGTFAPTDLAVISIGGNDARAYEQSLGLSPSAAQIAGLIAGAPAQAAVRVAQTSTGLNALVGAGARNITFLAGDVGRLPEVVGRPVAAVGSAYAAAYNAGIQAPLAALAAQGVTVNYLDLNLIGDKVGANLAAFGLTSAGACTGGTAGPSACVASPELANQFLFYVDQVHLSSRGFEIVGQYAVRQLEGPLQLRAQPDIGLQTASAFGSTLLGRLDLSGPRTGAERAGLNAYVTGNLSRRDVGRSLTSLDYDMDTRGVTAGVEYGTGGGALFGGAANYSNGDAEIGGSGEAEARNIQLGLYGAWAGGAGGFVEAYAGYGWVDYDIDREAVIDEISGSADGNSIVAGGRAGYLFGGDGVRFGPVIGLSYAKADIDAYTETGDPVLTQNIGEQDVKALTGSAGIEARATYEIGGLSFLPYAQATLEKDFEGNGRTIRYAGTASPTIVNSFVVPEGSKELFGRIAAGASIALGGALALEVNANATLERESGNDVAGFVGLKMGF